MRASRDGLLAWLGVATLASMLACDGGEGADPATGSVSSAAGAQGSGSSGGDGGAGGLGGTSSTTSAGGSGGAGQGGSSCVDDVTLAILQAHLTELVASAQLMATHPGELEATGFLLLPGLPKPPGIISVFAGPLVQKCSAPSTYDPFCEEGRCSQIECTGAGAGWEMHHWIEPKPLTTGEWTFDDARADTAWADGATGISFTLSAAAVGPADADWSLQGQGVMDLDLLQVTEAYPGLFAVGAATLDYSSSPQGTTGDLVVAGVTVATTDAQGHLVATGDCPP